MKITRASRRNPSSPARIHPHLDVGQSEVSWDEFFDSLQDNDFDGGLC